MPLNVLIVERSVLVRSATVQMVELCDAYTVAFEDAESALDALNAVKFDVLVAGVAPHDNSIPGFVSEAKSLQPSLAVVVGAAYSADTRYPKVVDAYVGFPCSLAEMRLAVRQAVDAACAAANAAGPVSVFR